MFGLVLTLHVLICFGLIMVVLLQSGKGGGLAGGAFGGTAQTVFGGRGATDFMTRATMVLGAAFFATSIAMAIMSSGGPRSTHSLIQEQARRAPATAPQTQSGAPGTSVPGPAPAPTQRAPTKQAPPPSAPATRPAGGGH
ncbi:MAG: preprotein translocase subunit SecG [Candidatus Eisenbacteria bacterium]|uniref:Protein-export membrane protein SecG n=1 Tax=Eiseniibacteriota bacterium TaxID=2212470 RepID=A0A9D6LA71_UNCEI|nr:preprotein translocase subunit SecG [Candidatus Eisenbacteria bacterium]MBI3539845.1 preprotein translocase subunit SecG [Candidatus Eisenbacteria bacterium]